MINFLIARMITQLDADFNGAGTPAIAAGPADVPGVGQLPRIVLSPGLLELPPPFGDLPAGEMRPRDMTDNFVVNTASPATVQGPYTLSQSPLEGSISCRFNWQKPGDEFEGKKQRIYPRVNGLGDGFEVDLGTKKLTVFFAAPLPETPTLEVDYNYPAVFTMCEFHQVLLLEVFASSAAEAEKWASLAAAVVTTRSKSLLEEANQNSNFQSSGSYVSRSLFNTFQMSDGLVDRPANNVFRYLLNFNITGQLILERTFTDSVDVIRKIYSPGHKSDAGTINIEANLD
jgi:hypothetical protein